jgi:hypothetical protein
LLPPHVVCEASLAVKSEHVPIADKAVNKQCVSWNLWPFTCQIKRKRFRRTQSENHNLLGLPE